MPDNGQAGVDPYQLMTADQVAALLGVSRRTFDRLVATGAFPPADYRKSRKLVRWRPSTVVAAIEAENAAEQLATK